MSNTVLLKRSSTPNSAPSEASLSYGELAINYADGNLYYKNSSNVVTVIASNQSVSVTGNVTGGNILTAGLVSAIGNVYVGTGNAGYVYGNAYYMTGVGGTSSGGNLQIYLRSNTSVNVPIVLSTLTIVGRTGNISVPITA